MKIPKTNWYKGSQKPVRSGVYLRLYPDGAFFCRFDAGTGLFGQGERTPERAMKCHRSGYQSLAWCGLSRNPDEVAK